MRVKLVRRKKTRTSGSKEHEKQRFYINIFFANVCVFNPRDGLRRKEGLLVVQLLLIRTPQVIKGDRTEVILDFEES